MPDKFLAADRTYPENGCHALKPTTGISFVPTTPVLGIASYRFCDPQSKNTHHMLLSSYANYTPGGLNVASFRTPHMGLYPFGPGRDLHTPGRINSHSSGIHYANPSISTPPIGVSSSVPANLFTLHNPGVFGIPTIWIFMIISNIGCQSTTTRIRG